MGEIKKTRNFHNKLNQLVLRKDCSYCQKAQFDINSAINKLEKVIKSLSVHGLGLQEEWMTIVVEGANRRAGKITLRWEHSKNICGDLCLIDN